MRFVDWSLEEQRIANVTANNPNIMGEFEPMVLEQLEELKLDVDFESLNLDALLQGLQVDFKMPGTGGKDGAEDQSAELRESFQIVITCANESEQSTLLQRFMDEGLKCRALI